MRFTMLILLILVSLLAFPFVGFGLAAGPVDPGPQPARAGAGAPLPGLTQTESDLFDFGLDQFLEQEGVEQGLGPRFNALSCAECHSQPAVGGTSPAVNPQVAAATANGMTNTLPSFIKLNGPVREARFKRNDDGSPDGGVHALFTIVGDPAVPDCRIKQPDFAGQLLRNNVIFRVPSPVFGAGLIEAIPDRVIRANLSDNSVFKRLFGISGKVNTNGNDGTVTRFGWKGQNKSLAIFSGEAYNVEQGVSNEIFPQERDETPACNVVTTPNDFTGNEGATHSNVTGFAAFMRGLAPLAPSLDTPGGSDSIRRGRITFNLTGCALCHTPTLQTGDNTSAALANKEVKLFSDLAVHNMGDGLGDGVSQGAAGPQEFRSSPLWGLGGRLFLLHDGRCASLPCAIKEHASPGSEANAVIGAFNRLPDGIKQDLLNFLRSL